MRKRRLTTTVILLLCGGALPGSLLAQASRDPTATAANIHARNDFTNSRVQFERKGTGHVAFIGGSITEMNGFRPMVCRNLQKRFPKTKFTFTDAGIASTCSTTGAFRLTRDVLSKGPVDLFFIEFAVNDDQDAAHARRDCIRGMEGTIRQCRPHNPHMDIVVTYFANPGIVATIQKGKTPLAAGSHEEVAKHYGVSTIDLAREVAEQITAGTLTWKKYGGTHPAPYGNAICAGMIESLLGKAWKTPLAKDAKKTAHRVPDATVNANHYGDGRSIDPSRAKIVSGWKLHEPEWKKIPGGFRRRFADTPLICATNPGDELTLEFSGKAIGAYVLAGPSAAVVLASIDGGDFKPVDLWHRHSRGLHYPRTVMFDADLKPGKHLLTLKVSEKKNAKSKGTAARILQFVAN